LIALNFFALRRALILFEGFDFLAEEPNAFGDPPACFGE
jgi:hypothetical protein